MSIAHHLKSAGSKARAILSIVVRLVLADVLVVAALFMIGRVARHFGLHGLENVAFFSIAIVLILSAFAVVMLPILIFAGFLGRLSILPNSGKDQSNGPTASQIRNAVDQGTQSAMFKYDQGLGRIRPK